MRLSVPKNGLRSMTESMGDKMTEGQQISLPIAESQHRVWLYAWRKEMRAEALHPLQVRLSNNVP